VKRDGILRDRCLPKKPKVSRTHLEHLEHLRHSEHCWPLVQAFVHRFTCIVGRVFEYVCRVHIFIQNSLLSVIFYITRRRETLNANFMVFRDIAHSRLDSVVIGIVIEYILYIVATCNFRAFNV
jgi:hypothetical protein